MASTLKFERISNRSLEEFVLERAHLAALKRYLTERGHALHTVYSYLDVRPLFPVEEPATRLRRYRPPDALLTFLPRP